MRSGRILIAATQVPFTWGGAEWHVAALHRELLARGFQAEVAQLPFQWTPRSAVLRSALAWRLLDLTESNGLRIDLVIGTRFPSYVVRHPNKVVWLFHQFRPAYDLHESGVDGFEDHEQDLRRHVIELDTQTLSECRQIYTTSLNNARRLERFNGLGAEILRLPLLDRDTWRCETYEPFVLSAGRLEFLKRTDLLVRAAAHLPEGLRVVIVGRGPLEPQLRGLAERLGVAGRVEFRGHVPEEELKRLYATCGAVFYAPYDEDYGLVTLEAFHSQKPVVTTTDAGGPLEFVRDGETGLVALPEPEPIAACLARLLRDPDLSRELGQRGYETVRHIGWDEVIDKLTSTLR
jgi:glycosyltransferase involved in cell wall biosynthesis